MSKILVADDSIAVRKVAERLLVEAGFEVALAANGEEALAYLAKNEADVIVCDVIMPDKSGYEVCAFVRSQPRLAAIPVLLISGIVNDEVTQQAQACQADGVLKKPFQGTSLKDKVSELLVRKHACTTAASSDAGSGPNQDTVSPHQEEIPPAPSLSSVSEPPETAPAHEECQKPVEQEETLTIRENLRLTADRLSEVESLLHAERDRAKGLADRIIELEKEVGCAREMERLLEEERRRASELESKVGGLEQELSRIPQLESMLREAQELAETARREAADLKQAQDTIAQLEAALHTEQASAAQLVQQMTELEEQAARGKEAESALARERERCAELERKANETEALLLVAKAKLEEMESELAAERRTREEYERRLSESEARATKTQGLKVLLSAERERSAEMAQKLAEAEWVAMNATRRLEEIGSKLREIASVASELSKGIGERESAT
ncbi:MAG: response regulator [Nitrospira sp.]|nr:response regulator [Nitrospira sp.]